MFWRLLGCKSKQAALDCKEHFNLHDIRTGEIYQGIDKTWKFIYKPADKNQSKLCVSIIKQLYKQDKISYNIRLVREGKDKV